MDCNYNQFQTATMSINTNPSDTEDNSTENHYSLQTNSFINNQGPVRVGLFFEDSLPLGLPRLIEKRTILTVA
jgi:hypothetical protein